MYAGDPDFVDDDVKSEEEEHAEWIYNECLMDNNWQRTRVLVIEGQRFQHEKHPERIGYEYDRDFHTPRPRAVCQARRPQKRCQCGLYELMWSELLHG